VYAPELETLDQLLGGELALSIIRALYADHASFARAVHALLLNRDVELLNGDGAVVPQWRWRELFVDGIIENEMPRLKLRITDRGSRRVR
jgi:hypothetical protein